jgi:hypothetical protein
VSEGSSPAGRSSASRKSAALTCSALADDLFAHAFAGFDVVARVVIIRVGAHFIGDAAQRIC